MSLGRAGPSFPMLVLQPLIFVATHYKAVSTCNKIPHILSCKIQTYPE